MSVRTLRQLRVFSQPLQSPFIHSVKRNHKRHWSTFHEWFVALPAAAKILTAVVGLPTLLFGWKSLMIVLLQNKLIYNPYWPPGSRTWIESPDIYGLGPYFSAHWIKTTDRKRLQAWLFRQDEPLGKNQHPLPLLIYFHGNAGNLGDRLPHIQRLFRLHACHLLLVSYRGFAKSSGRPSGKGLQKDARAVMTYVLDNLSLWFGSHAAATPIVLYGHSVGGGVAAWTALEYQKHVDALILENTFTSIPDLVRIFFPRWTPYPHMLPFLQTEWNTANIIPKIACPILFISGDSDEIIPPEMMSKLYSISKDGGNHRSRLFHIPAGMHNTTWMKPTYYVHMHAFLNSIPIAKR